MPVHCSVFAYPHLTFYMILSISSFIFIKLILNSIVFANFISLFSNFTIFDSISELPKSSPRVGDAVFVLLFDKQPCGTAFAVRCKHQNMLLTAAHNVLDPITGNITVGTFTIALGVERNLLGKFIYRLPMGWKTPKSVTVVKHDGGKDWAILSCPRGTRFSLDNSVILCPAAEVPVDTSTCPKFHMFHCAVKPFLDSHTNVLGASIERAMNLVSIAPLHAEMCFNNAFFQGSSGGVVVDSESRAVAIHLEARNSTKTPSQVSQSEIRDARSEASSVLSDREHTVNLAFDSFSTHHASTTKCVTISLIAAITETLNA
jgi:hypothetical protein